MPRTSKVKDAPKQPSSLPAGTVTFLFTDIEGSTQRWESHRGEMAHAVARHDDLMRRAIEKHGGFVFKTVGDAFCAAFGQPQDAVESAIDAQRALAKEDFASIGGLRARMAIHTGSVQQRNADYFGPTVNRVARLLAIAYGGQVVVSGAATDLLQGCLPAQTTLRDLGEHQLRDLAFPEHVYQLVAAGLIESFPPLRSLTALPNNLPRDPTAFVGREKELCEIKALLNDFQVVTLIGAAGIGKTRTALRVGTDLLDGSGDGVWFADFAQVVNQDYVVSTIAQVFNIQTPADRDPLDDLRLYLKNKRLLLILDNCEHVVTAVTRVVAVIVNDCPHVVVLATSREALGVHCEQVYRLPSLSVPPAESTPSSEEALKYEAVGLFVARSAALNAQFSFNDDKAPIVAEISRRLDGIALAIELAAARTTSLSLTQLSHRLDERFRLLTAGNRAALPRQQTLRAAIDWSYDLLGDREQMIFQRVSIFKGGWTLEAATEVCAGDAMDEIEVLDILSSLVNKSLVAVEFDKETQRYRLLESLRHYGIERLRKDGEFDVIALRHAKYFAAYAQRAAETWLTLPPVAWKAYIEAELDNLRAALEWCLEQGRDPLLGGRIAERLWVYWWYSLQEGRRWLEAARASIAPEDDLALSVAIDLALSRVLINFSWKASAHACERALAGARLLEDERTLARALFYVGEAQLDEQRFADAEASLQEARDLARRAGDDFREASALQTLARLYLDTKHLEAARAYLTSAMRLYGGQQVERNRAIALLTQAGIERAAGNFQRAIEFTREAYSIGKQLRDGTLQMVSQASTAAYLVTAGRYEEAKKLVHEALLFSREERIGEGLASAFLSCVAVATRDRDFERAARLFGYVENATRDRLRRLLSQSVDADWLVGQLRDELGDERYRTLAA